MTKDQKRSTMLVGVQVKKGDRSSDPVYQYGYGVNIQKQGHAAWERLIPCDI